MHVSKSQLAPSLNPYQLPLFGRTPLVPVHHLPPPIDTEDRSAFAQSKIVPVLPQIKGVGANASQVSQALPSRPLSPSPSGSKFSFSPESSPDSKGLLFSSPSLSSKSSTETLSQSRFSSPSASQVKKSLPQLPLLSPKGSPDSPTVTLTPPSGSVEQSPDLHPKTFNFNMLVPGIQLAPIQVLQRAQVRLSSVDERQKTKLVGVARVFRKVVKSGKYADKLFPLSQFLSPSDIRNLFHTCGYFWKIRNVLLCQRGDYLENTLARVHWSLENVPFQLQAALSTNALYIKEFCVKSRAISYPQVERFCTLFQNLKVLILEDSELDNRSLKFIGRLTSLTRLDLSDNPFLNDNFSNLANLVHLKSLSLWSCNGLQDESIRALHPVITRLENLDLTDCSSLTDTFLQELPVCEKLQIVGLSGISDLTYGGLQHVVKFKNARNLYLSRLPHMTKRTMLKVQTLNELRALSLASSTALSHEGLLGLHKLKGLQALDLGHLPRVDGSVLQVISHLKDLDWLRLEGCKNVTDQSLAHLVKLPHLRTLGLTNTNITKLGLSTLQDFKSLNHLQMKDCPLVTKHAFQSFLRVMVQKKCDVYADDYLYVVNVSDS